MKKLLSCALLILLTLSLAQQSLAGERRVNGLLLGAGAGAILGHATGQDSQSVILGSALGGAIGYAVGSSIDSSKNKRYPTSVSHTSVNHYQQHPHWSHRKPAPSVYRYVPERTYRHGNIHTSRYGKCKEKVTYTRNKGRVTKTIKTICKDVAQPRWKRSHYRWPR